jgi:hypothetical protein
MITTLEEALNRTEWMLSAGYVTQNPGRLAAVRLLREYRYEGMPGGLLTTLLDPAEATATDLAAAYAQRWEIESTFDELKTHRRGPRTVLRSKSPDLVLQEIWGHLCCHYAIRSLMAQAADHSGHDPDRVSLVAALRITRQTLAHPGAFPPNPHDRDSPGWLSFLQRLLGRLNPARRQRSAPRVIKRKMPRWNVKRAHHAAWPQPQHPPAYHIHPSD